MRRILLACAVAAGIGSLLLAGGFAWFAYGLATERPQPVANADGIVVLTGGASRIDAAISLLAEKRARRLLISGVNPRTTRDEIRAYNADHDALFDCCIDIGRIARSTVGNAHETEQWVRRNHFASVIVVTSSYHMPRAMLEFRRSLGHITLIAHPVVTGDQHFDSWWRDADTARLLVSEYLKYAAALVRVHIIEPYLPFLLTAIVLDDTN